MWKRKEGADGGYDEDSKKHRKKIRYGSTLLRRSIVEWSVLLLSYSFVFIPFFVVIIATAISFAVGSGGAKIIMVTTIMATTNGKRQQMLDNNL